MATARVALDFQPDPAVKARLLDKTDRTEGGCWDFCGASRGNGYGAMKVAGKVLDAHRVSYLVHHGPIPAGKLVMHTCDNRTCVNPDHLVLGDDADNAKDAVGKGIIRPYRPKRTEPLTPAEIAKVRGDYAGGVSLLEISRKYELPKTSLRRVLGIDKGK